MDADNGLRLDYEQTTQLLRTLVDVRFKLLAFVPTVAAAAVGLVGRPRPAAELLGVGMLGLLATLGIFVYELRNTQLQDAMVNRAVELERLLGLRSVLGASGPGGLFAELPSRTGRLLGVSRLARTAAWRSSTPPPWQGGRIWLRGARSLQSSSARRELSAAPSARLRGS